MRAAALAMRIRRPTLSQRIRKCILGGLSGEAANRGDGVSIHTAAASDWKSLQAGLFGMDGE